MKKTLLLLAMLPFVFMACEKDEKQDDKKTTTSLEMVFNDTTFNSGKVLINPPYTNNGKTTYTLFVFSEGLSLDTVGRYDDILGSGKMIFFTISSTDSTGLPSGNYIEKDIDYIESFNIINNSWNIVNGNKAWKTRGPISVTKSGSDYNINFVFTDSSNRKTSAKFQGKIENCNIGL
jgi:hypothetical protein